LRDSRTAKVILVGERRSSSGHARRELPVADRRGRALVFHREDLDRWMLGGIAAAPADVMGGEP